MVAVMLSAEWPTEHCQHLEGPCLLHTATAEEHQCLQVIAQKVVRLAEALPGVNVSHMVARQPLILFKFSLEALTANASALR